ncbi:hypothetical protein D3C71_1516250 [compost metagenome]
MRSTMPLGKATDDFTQSARSGSMRVASPATAFSVTWPLPGILSQLITVKGAMPASRRRTSPARMRPKAVFGASKWAASQAISGCVGSNLCEAGSI